MSAPAEAAVATDAARPGRSRAFRKFDAGPRLSREELERQGTVTRIAFQALGRERAISFLNTADPETARRPLELATGSVAGFEAVLATITERGGRSG